MKKLLDKLFFNVKVKPCKTTKRCSFVAYPKATDQKGDN